MSTILKAGSTPDSPIAISSFHLRDLMDEVRIKVDDANRQVDATLAEAKEQARRIRQEAKEQGHREGFDEGFSRGKQEGYDSALAAARQKFDQELGHLSDTLTALVTEFSEQRARRLREAESDFVDFALQIASRVVKSIGELDRDVAPQNLQSALTMVMAKSDATVRAHPDDLVSLKQFAKDLADRLVDLPHIIFVEDSSIAPGGVMVVTEDGEVDATLETQLQQIATSLMSGRRSEDG